MSPIFDYLTISYQRALSYALDMAHRTHPDQYTKQPSPGMNHPAWILGHLNSCYEDTIYLIGDPNFEELPKDERFKGGSTPIDDLAYYPNKDELIAAYELGHNRVIKALSTADIEIMEKPTGHKTFTTHGSMLVHLIVDHEWQHLGQFSAWRIAMGLERV